MNNNCKCKKEKCIRHGDCIACREYHQNSKRKRKAACERTTNALGKDLIFILIITFCIQVLFLGIKRIVFSTASETLFSRSIVTMLCMIVLLFIGIIYCKKKNYSLSILPKSFNPIYVISTLLTSCFYIVTIFFVNDFSINAVIILFYGSIITPVFEELLFRGFIWNRLNNHYNKQWKTYIIVTILFSLWHIGYAIGIYFWKGGNLFTIIIMKVLTGAVFGIITGALRYKTDNCYLGIIIHGILNALS